MNCITDISTSVCFHVRMPKLGTKQQNACVDALNDLAQTPCSLKDGIVVSREALEDMDRDDLPVQFCEMIDYLLNFQSADEYLFHP